MKFYAVVQDSKLPCFIEEPDANKCCSKKQLTASLSNAKKHCDYLRGIYPGHDYQVHELSFTKIDHECSLDWNNGM